MTAALANAQHVARYGKTQKERDAAARQVDAILTAAANMLPRPAKA